MVPGLGKQVEEDTVECFYESVFLCTQPSTIFWIILHRDLKEDFQTCLKKQCHVKKDGVIVFFSLYDCIHFSFGPIKSLLNIEVVHLRRY